MVIESEDGARGEKAKENIIEQEMHQKHVYHGQHLPLIIIITRTYKFEKCQTTRNIIY